MAKTNELLQPNPGMKLVLSVNENCQYVMMVFLVNRVNVWLLLQADGMGIVDSLTGFVLFGIIIVIVIICGLTN